jgi:hypothetical protein
MRDGDVGVLGIRRVGQFVDQGVDVLAVPEGGLGSRSVSECGCHEPIISDADASHRQLGRPLNCRWLTLCSRSASLRLVTNVAV